MLGCAQEQVNVGDKPINSRIVGDTEVIQDGRRADQYPVNYRELTPPAQSDNWQNISYCRTLD